jgi:hypothetical protein
MDSMIQTQQNLEASSITLNAIKNALSELRQLQESQVPFGRCGVEAEVQNVSGKEVTLKYGSGPHHVEMELVFPDKTDLPNLSLNLLRWTRCPTLYTPFSKWFPPNFDGCSLF